LDFAGLLTPLATALFTFRLAFFTTVSSTIGPFGYRTNQTI
jgi:hypothetical protein